MACPLFPLLKASLQGWRDYYCDSADQWHDCARYRLSLTGEPVPISLLPNGAAARHLEAATGPARPTQAQPHPTQTQGHPAQAQAYPAQAQAYPAQAYPAQAQAYPPPQAQPPGADPWAPEAGAWSQPTPTPTPTPAPTPTPPPSARTPREPGRKRGWWARLTEWMRSPA
ncbi:hypothetical protein NGF19_26285 [Streptomyces sp. RY43-2]|uniref:Uncharacterized protein n=1 Tax=Streptomyces macrolidinus TaxID=2952607 RepID=A0ABT0ZKX7_9ACTN|nr:hypothetical protein [Streptomyces macrolidinus]MCN9244249.1 hypothetical protein [Streptomyces macrolidinus]